MPSFDVVSRLDHQEIDNAIGNATREITTRYDFKGSDTSIEKKENSIIVTTPHLGASTKEAQLKAGKQTAENVKDILNGDLSSVINN